MYLQATYAHVYVKIIALNVFVWPAEFSCDHFGGVSEQLVFMYALFNSYLKQNILLS